MMYNLFLDDVRTPSSVFLYTNNIIYKELDWVIVRNYCDFKKIILELGLPNIISFDHDLAKIEYDYNTQKETFVYYEETGYDCALWLINYCILNNNNLPKYYCHSQNSIGKKKNN